MQTFSILCWDSVLKTKPELVKRVKTDSIEELKQELLTLQEGYCEDETPIIEEKVVTSNSRKLKALVASSDVDFMHVCPIAQVN